MFRNEEFTMKKQLLTLCLPVVLACSSFSANAAMILGFDAGVYVWQSSTTGTADGVDTAGMEGDNNVAYFAFEHPIPFVPNVKLQTTDMSAALGANSVDLSHTDSTIYYEILDNFVSVDIGLTSRAFDGAYDVGTGVQAMTDTTTLLYASAEVIVPVTGLSFGMEVQKDFGLDDNTIDDIKIRVRYEILGSMGLELGQRTVTMTLNESIPNTSSLEFSGTYLALTYTF